MSEAAATAPVSGVEQLSAKAEWILENFQCPICRHAHPLSPTDYKCSNCQTHFEQTTGALNLISPELVEQFNLTPTPNVSAHIYDGIAQNIIKKGGMVLDCGSGKKDLLFDNLVQMEIVDYENVDVLGVNQSLPFKDASFDAVFSLAVLEHVDQPFDCAAEIIRVLKPGGRLYVGVPFLQREHGYPHHYFGMTRMGLQRLFKDKIDIESHCVPLSGHPIWALWMTLQSYRDGLEGEDRQNFHNLRVSDFLSSSPRDLLGEPWVQNLSEEARWTIATTTQLIANKKSD